MVSPGPHAQSHLLCSHARCTALRCVVRRHDLHYTSGGQWQNEGGKPAHAYAISDKYCCEKEKVRSGPISRVLSWTVIYLEPTLPSVSSTLPERSAGHTIALLFAFAPEGACQATRLPGCWWSLTPPFQLFSHLLAQAAGVFFSAALSVGSPRPAVSRLPALWSPDFPHGASAPRSSGPLRTRHCSMFGTPVHAQKMGVMRTSPHHPQAKEPNVLGCYSCCIRAWKAEPYMAASLPREAGRMRQLTLGARQYLR